MRRILVIEGPAGSGKTTLIKRLSELLPATIISTPWITRPRSYDGIEGEVMALTKDVAAFAMALATPGDVLLDRWVISSWVYNRIRRHDNMNIRDLSCLIKTSCNIADETEHQLIHRGVLSEGTMATQRFLLLLPPLIQLEQRRAGAGREFPYSATEERFYYQEFADAYNHIPIVAGDESDLELYGIVQGLFSDVAEEINDINHN